MKEIKDFTQFVNESLRRDRENWLKSKGLTTDHGLRGEPFETFMQDLLEILELCPNIITISIPVDSNASLPININREGHEHRYGNRPVDIEEAIETIHSTLKRFSDFSAKHGQIVTFYIWNFDIPGVRRLENDLVEFGGSGKYQDIDTYALIQFLKQNPELAAKATSLNVTKDSIQDREFAAAMSRGDYGSLD